MARFLDSSGITYQLEQIIKDSRGGRLLLISPYLKFNDKIKDLLEDQVQSWKTNVYVVYGKTELRAEETEWLDANFVRTSYREHLHAKCYMNDSHALITSMNLYEFSQQHNDEMGILVSAEEDPELYQEIKEEADRILRRSDNVRLNVTRVDDAGDVVRDRRGSPSGTDQGSGSRRPERQAALPKVGFCLRCGTEVPFDPKRPYCNSDYKSWARFKNEEYEEKHCHACGNEHNTSMVKPVCVTCYRTHRSALRVIA